jgi:hypothetical protein
MTDNEAQKLAAVFVTADGGCAPCVRAICEEASESDLGFEWWLDEDCGSYPGTVKVRSKQQKPGGSS